MTGAALPTVKPDCLDIGEMWASMHDEKPMAEVIAAAVQAERELNHSEVMRLKKELALIASPRTVAGTSLDRQAAVLQAIAHRALKGDSI